jgi:hypothetical protein
VALLLLKFVVPLYEAVMAWLPKASFEVVNEAVPPLRLTVAKTVLPSLKVTVPVGVTSLGETGATVAVKVTAWPETGVLVLAVSVVVVLALLMVTDAAEAELLEVKLPAGSLNEAVMV